MRPCKISMIVVSLVVLLAAGLPPGMITAQAQDGRSPATAKPITVAPCSSVTVMDSAATTDPGTAIGYVNEVFYSNAGVPVVSPIHDWYVVTLDRLDNIKVEVTRANTSARLDVFLFAPIMRADKPEGVIPVDFSTGATGATSQIGPRAVGSMTYRIGIRAQSGSSDYILRVTRGLDTTQALFVDHRVSSTVIPASASIFLNRFTPTRYPATVTSITVFIQKPTPDAPDPSGQVLRFVVYADPMRTGKPPAGAMPISSTNGTLPMLDYSISRGLVLGSAAMPLGAQIATGDFYAGFVAPAHAGLGLRVDTDGLPLNASFVSSDNGATFNPAPVPTLPPGSISVVGNYLIRSSVTLSACTP